MVPLAFDLDAGETKLHIMKEYYKAKPFNIQAFSKVYPYLQTVIKKNCTVLLKVFHLVSFTTVSTAVRIPQKISLSSMDGLSGCPCSGIYGT
jgi:hypothetical protein